MVTSPIDEWFTIQLDKPHIVLAGQHSPSSTAATISSCTASSAQSHLTGSIIVTLTKVMNIRSLSIQFSGLTRSAFFFDSSSLFQHAQPCLPCGNVLLAFYIYLTLCPILTKNESTLLDSNAPIKHLACSCRQV